MSGFLRSKLDRQNRSSGERLVRGIIVLLALPGLLLWLGLWLTPFVLSGILPATICAFGIALVIRQRRLWDTVLDNNRTGTATAPENGPSLVVGYVDNLLVGAVLFAIGGFGLLLPYRFARILVNTEHPGRAATPRSPFLKPAAMLAEILALPATLLATFLLAMAHIFIPGTSLSAFKAMFIWRRGVMLSRFLPLSAVGRGLGLAFPSSGHKNQRWIGAGDGRAKLTTADTRQIGLIVLVAMLLTALVASMALAAYFA